MTASLNTEAARCTGSPDFQAQIRNAAPIQIASGILNVVTITHSVHFCVLHVLACWPSVDIAESSFSHFVHLLVKTQGVSTSIISARHMFINPICDSQTAACLQVSRYVVFLLAIKSVHLAAS